MKQFEKKYKKYKMKWKKIFGSDCILDKLRISYPKAVCQLFCGKKSPHRQNANILLCQNLFFYFLLIKHCQKTSLLNT